MTGIRLGGIPIAASIVSWMITNRLSAYQAALQAARQFEAFKYAAEAEISEMALELGRQTDIPYWEWFKTLRSAQRYGLLEPEPDTPMPQLPEPRPSGVSGVPAWAWVILIGMGVFLLSQVARY